jgi:hypothetical protein
VIAPFHPMTLPAHPFGGQTRNRLLTTIESTLPFLSDFFLTQTEYESKLCRFASPGNTFRRHIVWYIAVREKSWFASV